MSLNKYFTLESGEQIPSLGLGTAFMAEENTPEIVYNAIKNGVRLIDTAENYFREKGVGEGIKKAIEDKIVERKDLFIVTKLSPNERENPEEHILKSLKNLQLDYIDLYLDHWPKFFEYNEKMEKIKKMPMHVLWGKMESFVEKKYTRFIGVSNYNVQSLCNLLSFCKIKPIVNEVEFNPYFNQKDLDTFCRKEKILIFCYNPVMKGAYCQHFEKEKTDLLNDNVVIELSKKYNKTPGQIVLNWSVATGHIPIPMTNKLERMKENLGSLEFRMSDEDIKKIEGINKMFRCCYGKFVTLYGKEINIFS